MEAPDFAIIIPAYNCASTIERAVDSVLSQEYQRFKIYIINDASKDATSVTLSKYKKNNKIVIINHDNNKGVSAARNTGILNCSEKYVCFIDSDDEWLPHKLSAQASAIIEGDNLIVSEYEYVKKNSNRKINYDKKYISFDHFMKKKYRICFSSVCYNRIKYPVLFDKIGHEDFLFIYEILKLENNARVINEVLVKQYHSDHSLSSNKYITFKWHYKILKNIYFNSHMKIYYYLSYYVLNAIIFKLKLKYGK